MQGLGIIIIGIIGFEYNDVRIIAAQLCADTTPGFARLLIESQEEIQIGIFIDIVLVGAVRTDSGDVIQRAFKALCRSRLRE